MAKKHSIRQKLIDKIMKVKYGSNLAFLETLSLKELANVADEVEFDLRDEVLESDFDDELL
jgi:hypothetical protein